MPVFRVWTARQDADGSQYAGRLDGGPSGRGRRPAKRWLTTGIRLS